MGAAWPVMAKMRAAVFRGVNDLRVEEVDRPRAGAGEVVVRVTLTRLLSRSLPSFACWAQSRSKYGWWKSPT